MNDPLDPGAQRGLEEPPAPPAAEPPARVDQRWLATCCAGVIIVVSCLLVLWNLQTTSRSNANTGSRYATVEALVDYGTFEIDDTEYAFTIDKVKIGERHVSSKPPLLPTFAAGVYWVYQGLTGKTIREDEGDVLFVVGVCTGWLSHLVMLLYFWRLVRLLLKRELAQIVSLMAVAFATLGTAYATALNNHSVAGAFAIVAFYYALRAGKDPRDRRLYWVMSGLCAGFLPTMDLPAGAVSLALFVYVAMKDRRRALTLFLPVACLPVAAHFYLTYLATGSVLPTYLRRDLYQAATSYWAGRRSGIDGLREPKHIYAFHLLFGHHGLFSMTPLFVYSAIALAQCLRRRQDELFREALVVVSCVVPMLLFYVFKTRNYGGWCVGMRWLVVVMPLLAAFFGVWLDRVRLTRLTWLPVLAAFSVSTYHVQDGLSNPYQFSRWHNWLDGTPNRNRTDKKLNLGQGNKKPRQTTPSRAGQPRRPKLPEH